jgi:hypothetical protein
MPQDEIVSVYYFVIASQRVRAEGRPDDRLREAIRGRQGKSWIASALKRLAMTIAI